MKTLSPSPEQPGHQPAQPVSLRAQALLLLQIESTQEKARQVRMQDATQCALNPRQTLLTPSNLPGRPARPLLVQPSQLKTRAVGTPEGKAGLIHALTHIEANAINTV
jgi:uncharacterized ferritin-like protein (DUF455 family)